MKAVSISVSATGGPILRNNPPLLPSTSLVVQFLPVKRPLPITDYRFGVWATPPPRSLIAGQWSGTTRVSAAIHFNSASSTRCRCLWWGIGTPHFFGRWPGGGEADGQLRVRRPGHRRPEVRWHPCQGDGVAAWEPAATQRRGTKVCSCTRPKAEKQCQARSGRGRQPQ